MLTLGAVTVRLLQEHGVVSLFINKNGEVEVCPPGEVGLDGLPEDQALSILIDRRYTDKQLADYLKGREARSSYPLPEANHLGQDL